MKRIVTSMMMGALLLGGTRVVLADNEVNERQRNQQERIGKGVENGSLTAGETAHLARARASIAISTTGRRSSVRIHRARRP